MDDNRWHRRGSEGICWTRPGHAAFGAALYGIFVLMTSKCGRPVTCRGQFLLCVSGEPRAGPSSGT